MKRLFHILALAVPLMAFMAGAEEIGAQTTMNFVVLHQGDTALNFTKKQLRVITSQQEYAATLADYSSEAPQQLDFNAGRVLLVDMGQRATGGFTIEVKSVGQQKRSAVIANVQLTKPGSTCLVTQALTNPYQFVYIPTRKEILVSERLSIFECGGVPAADPE